MKYQWTSVPNELTTIVPLRLEKKLRDKFAKLCTSRRKEDGTKSSMNYELKKFIVAEISKK